MHQPNLAAEPPALGDGQSVVSLIASSSGSKRRGGSVTEHEHCEVKITEVIQGSKRHRMESIDLQTTTDGAESDEDVNIDGSYAASPLAGVDDEAFLRYTAAEMEIVRGEAYALGCSGFLQKYIVDMGVSVRSLLEVFSAQSLQGLGISDVQALQLLKYHLARFFRNRPKLPDVNTIEDVVALLRRSKRIMVLTGAGVSVSCGIPDFRSPTGIYTRLNDEFGLDDPQQMFDIEYFRETPELFYSFAKELYPYNFTPAPSHAFIKLLEDRGKLLRNYTQNIDTLEHVQGIKNVLNCHGSFASATCIKCGYQCDGKDLEPDIMAMRIAYCPLCNDGPREKPTAVVRDGALEHGADDALDGRAESPSGGENHVYNPDDSDDEDADYGTIQGIMKPDITFFGEKLPDKFDEALLVDRENVDLLLVMGSSLKVAPVSDIMGHLPHNVPQIVINKTPIVHLNFDVQLLGDADDIVAYLASACGWTLSHARIPGGSTESAEFKKAALAPVPAPESISITLRAADGEAEPCEKTYHVPAHWHPFPSAIITGKDLHIASGDARVRLAIDSSDEECDSGSDEDSEDEAAGTSDGEGDGSDDSVGSESLARDIGKATV
ncbi:NAD-dependent histone deacetylase sir2 [Coemansia sp. 'formosensis']|nr:NAD-dependent histone deacetylase sir2 [Coemansia sp. 'formosensis']